MIPTYVLVMVLLATGEYALDHVDHQRFAVGCLVMADQIRRDGGYSAECLKVVQGKEFPQK
jgi:hypothetical protein